jgi:hypothetical protein
MPRFTIQRNPMRINAASVIESAISARVIVAVTAAAYVVVTGVSGRSGTLSLRRAREAAQQARVQETVRFPEMQDW